jgi:hypothetical protein
MAHNVIPIAVGTRFGRWRVIFAPDRTYKRRRRIIVVQCQCLTIHEVDRANVVNRSNPGCLGCRPPKAPTHGHNRIGRESPTHRSWRSMLYRCEYPSQECWPRYGGNGVTVCERWHTFENFLTDMGERPSGTTLDRIENDKGYEPGNCRWATRHRQNLNRKNTKMVTFQGTTKPLADWADEYGLSYACLHERLLDGWPVEDALRRPKFNCGEKRNGHHWLTYDGKTLTVTQWGQELGLPRDAIWARLRRGWSIEKTLSMPLQRLPMDAKGHRVPGVIR